MKGHPILVCVCVSHTFSVFLSFFQANRLHDLFNLRLILLLLSLLLRITSVLRTHWCQSLRGGNPPAISFDVHSCSLSMFVKLHPLS